MEARLEALFKSEEEYKILEKSVSCLCSHGSLSALVCPSFYPCSTALLLCLWFGWCVRNKYGQILNMWPEVMDKVLKIKSKNYLCFYQQKASKEKPTQNKQKCCFSPLKKREIFTCYFFAFSHMYRAHRCFLFLQHIYLRLWFLCSFCSKENIYLKLNSHMELTSFVLTSLFFCLFSVFTLTAI